MSAQDVGKKLVSLCQKGEFLKAIDELYGKNIVSVEPMGPPGTPLESSGFDAVRGKSVWWMENHEVHSASVTGPYVHGDKFIVGFEIDVTEKSTKKRMQMKEMGVYSVAGDKVVREEFYFMG